MAVTLLNPKSSLRIYFEVGVDGKGNPIYRSKSYSNVKPTATPEEIFALAGTIGGLQDFPMNRVVRGDQADLQNSL